jgi:hypothetical protein
MLPTDLQEILDVVAAHLMQQGVPALRSSIPEAWDDLNDGVCAYLSPDGLRCAVGAFIPEELYRRDMEGQSAAHVLEACGLISEEERKSYAFDDGSRLDLLTRLQRVHDEVMISASRKINPADPDKVRRFWAERLRDVARDFGLNPPPAIEGIDGC